MAASIPTLSTDNGIDLFIEATKLDYKKGINHLIETLDNERGMFLSSGIEYPDRYSRWEIGFVSPPLEFIAQNRTVTVNALNKKGALYLQILKPILTKDAAVQIEKETAKQLILTIAKSDTVYSEEERSKQPTVLTPIRALVDAFRDSAKEDTPFSGIAGVYGSFAYDLLFQFEEIDFSQKRDPEQKLFHLFFPDEVYALDRQKESAYQITIDLTANDLTTIGIKHKKIRLKKKYTKKAPSKSAPITSDHVDQDYMDKVEAARERMRVGDIFEVVLRREFKTDYTSTPSTLYHKCRDINPSPYEFFVQLGDEQLVGTSPEMFVRVAGKRVESCPISGTVKRTGNPMEDEEQIVKLLTSEKDKVELTMCTDVDRNDKSRICEAGTIKLLGRRQIEAYKGLYHTVDHVEGQLRKGFTAIDAFLSHMWAVTLTGAPKKNAVQIVEDVENSPRLWYGGAIGCFSLDGGLNTGITIRTTHLKDGAARYNVGATLVYDSRGDEEELETRTKATSFFRLFGQAPEQILEEKAQKKSKKFSKFKIVMIDNEDSFVHTLADYFRQTGADVKTFRSGISFDDILAKKPDLVVHSPGPGIPTDFGVPTLVQELTKHNMPQFGVCLGLQGTVEAFGGKLRILEEPRHGKTWNITHQGTGLFEGIDSPCTVGAYHSIVAEESSFPHDDLEVLAKNETGLIMAVKHKKHPIYAVQFHPESILSLQNTIGNKIIENLLQILTKGA
ncbi:MAG: anthranilate synthase component I [Alphaproteobacteria bacterium]